MDNPKKILITGGHLSPALAVLPTLLRKGWQIVYVGRSHAFSDYHDSSLEYQLLAQQSLLKFYTLETGRFNQYFKFLKGLKAAWQIVSREKPSVVLSFGGYISVPLVIAAKLKGIPINLHEQTISPGRANRFLSRLADRILITFPQTTAYFPKAKTSQTGIVLNSALDNKQKPRWFVKTPLPLLLVVGGSTGSHSINVLIESILSELQTRFQIVHQTGENRYQDYAQLLSHKSARYLPVKHLLPEEMGYFYQRADLVISRAGANTFFELLHFKKPAILIPLPWSANHEQELHARILAENGAAYVFSQTLSAKVLWELIKKAYNNLHQMRQNFAKLKQYDQCITQADLLLAKMVG